MASNLSSRVWIRGSTLALLVLATGCGDADAEREPSRPLPAPRSGEASLADWLPEGAGTPHAGGAPHGGGAAHDPHGHAPSQGDPHAGIPGAPHLGGDPHAGIPGAPSLGGDPHAGVPGAPSLGGDPHAGVAGGPSHPPPGADAPIPPGAAQVRGTVAETRDAAGYTYMRLDTPEGEVWVAGLALEVAVGARVEAVGTFTEGFRSNSLDRTFERLLLATRVRVVSPS